MPLLPKPYPDEVIGSVVARACRHTGLPMRRLLKGIFDRQRTTTSFLLGDSVGQLAILAGLEPEELLVKHTMLPYTTAFMTPAVQAQLTAKALTTRSREDSLSSLTKNVSHGVAYRRVCKKCIVADLQHFGESYWHRQHLLPGVLVCRHHAEPLFETSIALRGQAHASDIVLPHEVHELNSRSLLPFQLLLQITEISVAALQDELHKSENWLHGYRVKALELGYVLPSCDVASVVLSHMLVRFFGRQYLLEAGCPAPNSPRTNWPSLMVRPSTVPAFTTVKHVLMHAFLQAEIPAPTDMSLLYSSPGKVTRDYKQFDTDTLASLRICAERAALAGKRITIESMLRDAGAWSAFKHSRKLFPKTAAFLQEFRYSDQSERQLGGRPYWRKRMPSRYGTAEYKGDCTMPERAKESESR